MTFNFRPFHPIYTASGVEVDLYDIINPSIISHYDIINSLASISRFNGHTKFEYKVAAHSVFVWLQGRVIAKERGLANLLEDHDFNMLLLTHDAHEAYIGDITTPIFNFIHNALQRHGTQPNPLLELRKEFDDAIQEYYFMSSMCEDDEEYKLHFEILKEADLSCLKAESLELCSNTLNRYLDKTTLGAEPASQEKTGFAIREYSKEDSAAMLDKAIRRYHNPE